MSNAGRGGSSKTVIPPLGNAVNAIQHPTRLFVVGRSQMGKTTALVQVILKRFMNMDRYIVICPSFREQETYAPIRHLFQEKDIHENPKPSKFKEIMDELRNFRAFAKTKGINPKTLILIDDMAGQSIIHGNGKGAFANFATRITHLNASCCIATQMPKTVDPNFRSNAENFMVFPSESEREMTWLNDSFNSTIIYDKKTDFKDKVKEAWKGKDGKIGEHFMFIHSAPRKLSRFFSDFDFEVGKER
jgi:Poxvirus A32 protein